MSNLAAYNIAPLFVPPAATGTCDDLFRSLPLPIPRHVASSSWRRPPRHGRQTLAQPGPRRTCFAWSACCWGRRAAWASAGRGHTAAGAGTGQADGSVAARRCCLVAATAGAAAAATTLCSTWCTSSAQCIATRSPCCALPAVRPPVLLRCVLVREPAPWPRQLAQLVYGATFSHIDVVAAGRRSGYFDESQRADPPMEWPLADTADPGVLRCALEAVELADVRKKEFHTTVGTGRASSQRQSRARAQRRRPTSGAPQRLG